MGKVECEAASTYTGDETIDTKTKRHDKIIPKSRLRWTFLNTPDVFFNIFSQPAHLLPSRFLIVLLLYLSVFNVARPQYLTVLIIGFYPVDFLMCYQVLDADLPSVPAVNISAISGAISCTVQLY
jgi:hypothetical protein